MRIISWPRTAKPERHKPRLAEAWEKGSLRPGHEDETHLDYDGSDN